jgi:biopolymer transport protein ExbD
MKITKRATTEMSGDCDMTPMIDMTFQLIIFLMLMVNFSQADQDAAILLPTSELAKPPDKPLDTPITLNVIKNGNIIVAGHETHPEGLKSILARESDSLTSQGKSTADAHIIIRGHGEAPVGKIQEVIKICQEARFERFALRAKEDDK